MKSKPSKIVILKAIFIGLLILIKLSMNAQSIKPAVKLLTRALPDSIMLRWAPNNFEVWNAGNKYGYSIIRFTLMRNGSMIKLPQPEIINADPIKPLPVKQWEKLADIDDYAGVAAQAIFGTSFELTPVKSTSVFDVVNKVKEQESRFSFALYAADQSSPTARMSGLWYTDKNVKKGEKYLYRVFLSAPREVVKADTGFSFTGIDESLPLPKPLQLRAEFGDKSVILHWDRKTLNYIYNSYILEKSSDGINFKKVKDKPFVYALSGDFQESDEMMFIDSLVENNKNYTYRLFGRTPFGETGPSGEIVKGIGITEIKSEPNISVGEEQNGHIIVKWSFPENENNSIKGFEIIRSSNYKTNFDTISPIIKSETRQFSDASPKPTNYYKVVAIGKNGHQKTSLPSLIQLSDTIPPSPPVGLSAIADTTGKLTLTWHANKETDIFGYRVFRANATNEEYAQMTSKPIKDTVFIDHINLKTLTKKIFYQLMAIDKRQNHSVFSLPIEVERPDIVPPAPAIITNIKSSYNGVILTWENSSSNDVIKHLILRRGDGSKKSLIIKEIQISDTTKIFTDSTTSVDMRYYYSIIAEDKSGLHSIPTEELAGQKITGHNNNFIEGLKTSIDRKKFTITLSWNKPNEIIQNYIIYRQIGDRGLLAIYKNITGDIPVFIDTRVIADTRYKYFIKGILKNGGIVLLKTILEIQF